MFIALFLSTFWIHSFSYAQGWDDPISGIDIIIKEYCGRTKDNPCPINLYRCEDGTVVTNSTDCGGQISIVKYMKIDGIDSEVQDKIAATGEAMWLCDNGDIVGRPSDCKNDTDILPIMYVTEEMYLKISKEAKASGGFPCYDGTTVNDPDDCKDILPAKEQVEKIEWINGEGGAGDDSDDATTKQGENNDPVPGIDIIVTEASVASPSTLYRCENGKVVEDSADCGPQIGMVKYMRAGTGDHGGLDRLTENVTIVNSVHICDDGTQVSLPSECDTDLNDITIYVPADDFYRIEWHIGKYFGSGWGAGKINVHDIAVKHHKSNPCTGPEDTSPGCDGVADATTKQGGNDPVPWIDVIIKRETIAGPSTFYRCEDGTVIELGETCPPVIVKVPAIKAKKINKIDSDIAGNSSDDATTKQEWRDPIEGIDIIIKKCTPYPECDKRIVWDSNLSPKEIKAEKRKAQRVLYKVKEVSVNKYKKRFNSKLKRVLPKIPEKKFDEILERIDTMLEKTENNAKLSDKKRETLLSAILAIKEIIEDEMNTSE